jgi:hypothetical protein
MAPPPGDEPDDDEPDDDDPLDPVGAPGPSGAADGDEDPKGGEDSDEQSVADRPLAGATRREKAERVERSGPEREDRDVRPLEEEARVRGRLEQFIPEIVRRTIFAGLGAVFTTEEGIRKLASEIPLPKEVVNFLIQQAGSSKDELFRIVARELRTFLESANLAGELQKLLTSLSFEIKTEVRFIPNDEAVSGLKPDLKRKVTIKRSKDEN